MLRIVYFFIFLMTLISSNFLLNSVEKTLEQCYLGYHNSQRTEMGV